LTIYTKHYGKIKAIAKGVRKITSRKGGNLELFNHCVLFLAEGKNLDIVTEAQVINSFSHLRSDLGKTADAFYIVELVDKLTPEGQGNRAVFDLLIDALRNLDIRSFEIDLLRVLGFWSDKVDRRDIKGYIEEIIEKKLKSSEFQKEVSQKYITT